MSQIFQQAREIWDDNYLWVLLVCFLGIVSGWLLRRCSVQKRPKEIPRTMPEWNGKIVVHFWGAEVEQWEFYDDGEYSIPPNADVNYVIFPGALPGKAPFLDCYMEDENTGEIITCAFKQSFSCEIPGMKVTFPGGISPFHWELPGWKLHILANGSNGFRDFAFNFSRIKKGVKS